MTINVGPLEGGEHKCESNNATDEKQFTFLLENKPAYTFLAIKVKFYIDPCLYTNLEFRFFCCKLLFFFLPESLQ